MDSSSITTISLLIILILFSTFYSCSETAFTSFNKIRLRTILEDENDPLYGKALIIDDLLSKSDQLLSTILVGNNLVNMAASSLTTSFVIKLLGNEGIGVAIATGAITLLILIFGEITPKTFATKHAEAICFSTCRFIRFNRFLFTPVVMILTFISRCILKLLRSDTVVKPVVTQDDLKTYVNVSHEEGVLEDEEKQMLHNVFEFGDTEIKEIMTPRVHVTAVSDDITYDELINVLRDTQFSRIPVYSGDLDEIVGVLNIKDLVMLLGVDRENFKIRSYMRKPHFVYEFHQINDVFQSMRLDHVSLAIVLDEYGIMSGLVSMEDIVEEIVGEIDDEYDEDHSKTIHQIGDNEYIIEGSEDIDNINEICHTSIETEAFESIGGYVLGALDSIPDEHQEVQIDDLLFTIEKMSKNRITLLRMKVIKSKQVDE